MEKFKQERENLTSKKKRKIEPFLTGNKDNVLVIGDLHEPFCLHEYLQFCRKKQEEYNCGTVVFIGDIIDNHYSSYHESELDTDGPNKEFDLAKEKIKEWYYNYALSSVIATTNAAIDGFLSIFSTQMFKVALNSGTLILPVTSVC